jgi:tripartite-type tricarboxylate transporter receptor subunit TctC
MLLRNALVALGLCVVALAPAKAQTPESEFYKGKTITILVGFAPGGGYDLYGRIVARFLPKYIPGKPTVIVHNMAPAGGLQAANNVYAVAPKDGTVIASVNASLLMYQLLGGSNARYDSAKLAWVGSGTNSNNSIVTWHTSGIRTIEDAKKQEVPMGSSGPASTSYIYPAVANALVGTKFKLIHGYTGSNSLDLAMERGEIAGRSGANLNSLFARNSDWVNEKKINFLAQIGYERDPALPEVPTLGELVTDKRAKQIVDIVTLPTAVGYAYWVAPEVPSDRLAILRSAFAQTFADREFVAEVEKAGFDVRPVTGERLQEMVAAAANAPQDVLRETAAILDMK